MSEIRNPTGDPVSLALFRQLAGYNRWMNDKIYNVASELSDQDRRRDLGAFFGSVHLTLTHLLITDRVWLARLSGEAKEFHFEDTSGAPIAVASLSQDVYPHFPDLLRARNDTDRRLVEFTQALTPESLERLVTYPTISGAQREDPAWWCVAHLFNHQTHHRGQATTLLSKLGKDPGVTDLLAWLREDFGGQS